MLCLLEASSYYITGRVVSSLSLAGNWEEELEFGGQLVLGVQAIGEVDSSNSAVCVNLNAKSLYVVSTVGTTSEIGQVELNLVPALVQPHGHGTDEGLHTGGRLIVRRAESASNVLIVQNLHFEGEVFLQLKSMGFKIV